jgi:hypothetical protein
MEDVVRPALAAPTALERLKGLGENFLRYVEEDAFVGGCFFASVAAEMDTHPGLVRDRAVEFTQDWFQLFEATVRAAQEEGAIDSSEEATQLAFELDAYLLLGNAQFVATGDRAPLDRARHALDRRLEAASA